LAALLVLSALLPGAVFGESRIRIPFTIYGVDAGRQFITPRGLCFDKSQDEILVADPGNHRVMIFDAEGWPKYEFLHWIERAGERIQGEPGALAVAPEGNIFIIDQLSPDLFIVNFRGQTLRIIQPGELCPGSNEVILAPCLAVGPEGHVYAVCKIFEDHQLIKLTSTGEVVEQVFLGQPGELMQVTGLAVDDQRIYISDLSAVSCVQVFDRQGRRELAFGVHDTGMGNFSFPAAIAVNSDGQIWVVDQIRQIVNHFDSEGKFLGYLGGQGVGPGSMSYPCAVAVDRTDRVMVLEKVGRRVQAFDLLRGGDAASKSGA